MHFFLKEYNDMSIGLLRSYLGEESMVDEKLILASIHGVVIVERDKEGWREIVRALEEERPTSVIGHNGLLLAGARSGVYRLTDAGQSWKSADNGLNVKYVLWLAAAPDDATYFAGTEPASIFISRDGADTWEESAGVVDLREHYRWSLPYSPEAGCVRGFAFNGGHTYAAVEVGGALHSSDNGSTWELVPGSSGRPFQGQPEAAFVHADVRSIEIHPSSPEHVFAQTGGGFYISQDGGATWNESCHCYCRAAWVDPEDAQHIILGPAEFVDRGGRIEMSRDGGETWQTASDGLDTPWPRTMVERFTQVGAELLAMLSNGKVYAARLDGLKWRRILSDVKGVRAIAVI